MTLWNTTLETDSNALYLALADRIESAIEAGELTPGQKLPTHRKLAEQLKVTVGTVTRGYAEAERRGLLNAIVGSGTYVSRGQQNDVQFSHLNPHESVEIDLSLNLPIANQPAPGLDKIIQQISQDKQKLHQLMLYQQESGLSQHQIWAANWFNNQGIHCHASNVTICCGGQNAVLLALSAATRAGDSIAAEGLTYPGLKAAANQLELKQVGLSMDEEGIQPDAFLNHCKLNNLRALYLCPSVQNPSNASMSLERRKQIVEIAKNHDVWIIEDGIPGYYAEKTQHSFINLAPEISFYIDSHSKTLAPGLRVGYLISPKKLTALVTTSLRAQCWFAPSLNVEIAQRWHDDKVSENWFTIQSKELATRQKIGKEILGGYDITTQQGSFHLWLKLPEPWRADAFKAQLLEKSVRVLSAESFAVGRFPAPQAVRISLTGPTSTDQLKKGLDIIKQQLDQGQGNDSVLLM